MIFDNKVKGCIKCKKQVIYDNIYCKECLMIKPNHYLPIKNDEQYIWSYGIEENGLEWYKEARDKLILKKEKERLKRKQEQLKEHKKIKTEIDKWK
jgi:hypothetical protein